MTIEEVDFLKQFETNFNTAIKSDYTRNIVKKDLLKMLDIYKRETGRDYNLCTHCNTSILSFLKLLGKVYFDKVREGNEPVLKTNDLQKTVAKKENKKKKINIKNV